jgi:hypothetical protein
VLLEVEGSEMHLDQCEAPVVTPLLARANNQILIDGRGCIGLLASAPLPAHWSVGNHTK